MFEKLKLYKPENEKKEEAPAVESVMTEDAFSGYGFEDPEKITITPEGANYTFEITEDEYRRKWVEKVIGSGEFLIIPDDVHGIMIDSLNDCEEAKKIWIPKKVKVIAPYVFSGFGSDATIYCEADEQPDGWTYKETGMTTTGFGTNMEFEVLVDSWQGSYVYKCDADDNISFINKETTKVVWGSKFEDLK